ncbi:hypothetical protein GOQ27_01345 [Clostridium sp. D2Q-11]|uniref:Uncharacterized protein n=1 Tax=Anaeromonas frigoriresistens TaxID=2683708 RepID=A0A942UTE2_9FIRM|nr:hypothetical protein [Anaeromonas frigoriresistens]MBS4537085.1 hypothetical protein [Anaeromonas frigoriresistens]
MLVNTNLALAIRCNKCGKIHTNNITLFQLKNNSYININCNCGETKARIKTENYKEYCLEIPCFACEETHIFKYSLDQLLKGNLVIRCLDGVEICFLGDETDVKELLKGQKDDFTRVIEELSFYDYFTNNDIMTKSVNKIKELEQEGSIICECGEENIGIDLFSDRIEIKCLQCNGVQIIYAESDEDFNNLLSRDYIMIHKHAVEYIDAFKFNNDR